MSEYSFRAARSGEALLLRPLWRECFGDGEAFMRCYEERMFRPERVELALLDGREVVSMLTVLPATLRTADGASIPGGCVYGVATLKAHRGRGVATALLGSALRRLDLSAKCMAVVPDTPELFDYYSHAMGAQTAFYVRELHLTAEDLCAQPSLRLERAAQADYLDLRRHALRGRTFLDWDMEALAFQQAICRMEGGDLYLFPEAPGCCAAAQRDEEGRLLVCELLGSEELLQGCLAGLLMQAGCREAAVRLPAWSGAALGGQVEAFAMLTGPSIPAEELAYLGFDFA